MRAYLHRLTGSPRPALSIIAHSNPQPIPGGRGWGGGIETRGLKGVGGVYREEALAGCYMGTDVCIGEERGGWYEEKAGL